MSPQDIALIQRWNDSKDPDAFAEIVRLYAGLVYGSCLRVLRNASDAEDVAQECFMRLAKAPVHVSTSLGGWLHTMATRRAINRLRDDTRRSSREETYAKTQTGTAEAAWDDVQHLIDEAIAGLPEDLRTPLFEHYMMGRTLESIGEEIGVTRQAVSQRVQKAVERIRTELRRKGVPLAPVILSAGFVEMVSAQPSKELQKGLLNSAIGGIDADTLTQVATSKTAAPVFSPLAYAVVTALIVAATIGLWFTVQTWSTGPSLPPAPRANATLPLVDSIAGDDGSTPFMIAQDSTTGDPSTIASQERGTTEEKLTPNFTEFSLTRPFPEPGVGAIYVYMGARDEIGAEVTITYVNWNPWEKNPQQRLELTETISDDHIAVFRNLPIGDYNVHARKGSRGIHALMTVTGDRTGIHLPLSLLPRSGVEFDLRNEAGESITQARAQIYQHQWLGELLQFGLTAIFDNQSLVDGILTIPDVIVGSIRAYIEAPGHAPVLTDWVNSRANPVPIVMNTGGSFSCRVVDNNGQPVEGVIVHLQGHYFGDHGYAYTGQDGTARVANLRSIDYRVRVYSEQHVSRDEPPTISIVENEVMEIGDILVVSGTDIQGRVFDIDTGEGISGVRLSVKADIGVAIDDIQTNDYGYYTIPNASFVRYEVQRHPHGKYGYSAGKRTAEFAITPNGVEGEPDLALSRGIPVSGRVIDTDGRPVSGAWLRAGKTRDNLQRDSNSDRNGRFTLNTISEPGPIYVRAQAVGFGRLIAGPFEIPEEGRDDIVVRLPHGAMVAGSIRINGQFAPRRTFLWSNPVDPESEEGQSGTRVTYTYTSPIRGTYLLTWLTPGSYNLSVQPPGGSTGPVVATVTVSEGQLIENFDIDYRTSGYALTGTVVDRRGQPIGAAQLYVFTENSSGIQARSGGNGTFAFTGLGDGYHTLEVSHPDYSRIRLQDVEAPQQALRLVLPDRGSVKGQVRSAATGEFLQRFRIAHYAGLINEIPARISNARTISSETGDFTLDDIEIGDTTLVVTSENHAPALVHIADVPEGKIAPQVEVVLQSAAVLEGSVTNADGNPIQGASIHHPTNSYSYTGGELSLARTDADGKFRTDRLQDGERTLVVSHPEYAPTEFSIRLSYGERSVVEIVLFGGAALSGTIYSGDTPLEGAVIMLTRADGRPANEPIQTDATGQYRFDRIPAGDYLITVHIRNDEGDFVPSEPYSIAFGNSGTQLLDWTY